MSPNKIKKYIVLILVVVVLAIASFAYLDNMSKDRNASDSSFILIDEKISKDKKLKLITYKLDIGALGYSRIYWAVVPQQYRDLNLRSFELPDGYKGIGWTDRNQLLVEEWVPYYHIERQFKLNDGELYKGAQIKIISNTKR
jgi:hypothetical protein